jgi:hypothetical protein
LYLLIGTPALAQAQSQPQARINPTDPQPTCPMCPGTYIPLSELEAYTRKALAEKLLDQQVRDIDIGKGQYRHRHGPSWQARQAKSRFSRRT